MKRFSRGWWLVACRLKKRGGVSVLKICTKVWRNKNGWEGKQHASHVYIPSLPVIPCEVFGPEKAPPEKAFTRVSMEVSNY